MDTELTGLFIVSRSLELNYAMISSSEAYHPEQTVFLLKACGLVLRRPNVGARVVTLSSAQLIEIFHVREALEGMAARLAAQNMSDDEIADLERLLE